MIAATPASRPRRILILHSRYLSGAASGENRVVEDEIDLLRQAGHHVEAWTPSPPHITTTAGAVRAGADAVWSSTATRHVRRLIRTVRPEVVHVHNLFPMISPAVIRAAAGENIPVVVTLHNYRLLCLPATFLRDGRVCEDCLGHVPWRGVVHHCYRASRAGSAALASSLTLHRAMGTLDRVSLFLAVSAFVRGKHVQAGFPSARVTVKPNFAWASRQREGAGDYFLYLGRLSSEKGLQVLLEAWRSVDAPLLLVGDGDQRSTLERSAPEGVHFEGAVPADRAAGFVRGARALILPSTCYEGAPRSIPEAYAAGVPVIASDIGGIAECVWPDESGFLVPAGSASALSDAARRMLDDEVSQHLGAGGHARWRQAYTPEEGLKALEAAYDRAVAST